MRDDDERAAARLASILSTLPTAEGSPHRTYRTAELRPWLSKKSLRRMLERGLLLRPRRGIYLVPRVPDHVEAAVAEGARVCCVTVLKERDVFVRRNHAAHWHFERTMTRYAPSTRVTTWHWRPLIRVPHPAATHVDIVDALAQATRCQEPRDAVASLDSALHLGLIDLDDLDEIFAHLPARYQVLKGLVDGRAESGTETIVRLIARLLGFRIEVQVRLSGVGRVDLVLDGWLIVECDSEQFHSDWKDQKRDRRRDLAAAAKGMVTFRPIAEDIMYRPETVVAALRGLKVAHRRGFPSVVG